MNNLFTELIRGMVVDGNWPGRWIGTRGGVHGDDRRHGFSLNGVYPLIVPHFPLPRCAELSGSYQHMLCALTQMAYRALRLHFEVTLGIRSTVGDNQNKI